MRKIRPAQDVGRAFMWLGALALAGSGWNLLESFCIQKAASRRLRQQINHSGDMVTRTAFPVHLQHGDAIGWLEIARIRLSVMVLEGTDADVLEVAAGHVPGTALPGTAGNAAIAAHRDTFFRPLRNIGVGDTVTFVTSESTYLYRVESTEIVNPKFVQALAASTDAELTLLTCYPFSYFGAAPQRFIVHARKLAREK
jgi:sortase A